jgi:outer membrane receptor protein involved in Fe transport
MMKHASIARCSALAALCIPAVVLAADATPPEEATLEEVIVTAQFREQNIFEVPLAVTAYGGDYLNSIGVDSFEQLSNFVPGFLVQEQSVNNPGFVLRGITSDDGASNIEPRVSVFQNGVSIARSRGSVVQLFDLERVEVLKGPQGTLFGRSAQNGAVHVITKRPQYGAISGEASAEFGNFNQRAYEGSVNLPVIADKLAVRLAGISERRDGFVNNSIGTDLNGKDSDSLRGSLRWDPTESLRIDLIGSYSEDSPPGTAFKSGVIPALGGSTDPFGTASLNTFGNFLGGRPLGVERRLNDVTAIVEWRLSDAWQLTSTTGYREFDSLEVFDPDGSAFEIFTFAEDAQGEQRSSDVRFSFDNGGKLTGFFGGGVFKEKGRQDVPLGFNVGNVVALFQSLGATSDPLNGVAVFGGVRALANALLSGSPAMLSGTLAAVGIPINAFQVESFGNGADNTSYDVFADASYELTDRLTFTAGVRYTRDEKESFFESALIQPSTLTSRILAPGLPLGAPVSLLVGNSLGRLSSDDFPVDDTFEGTSFRGILNYEFATNKFVYLSASRGRRPKVIQDDFATTSTGGVSGGFSVIPAEIVDSYEIGTKGAYFDNLLSFDAAIYYFDYENFQTAVLVGGAVGQAPDIQTVNGGSADSYGIELGARLRPIDGLDVIFTYGYNRGRFDSSDENGNRQMFADNRFRLAPDNSLSLALNYRRDLGFGTAFVTPTYTRRSSVFFEESNMQAFDVVAPITGTRLFSVPAIREDSFGLVNLRAGIELDGGRWVIEGYAENLLDREYLIDAGNTGGGFGIPTFIPGPPRFYGGAIKVRF